MKGTLRLAIVFPILLSAYFAGAESIPVETEWAQGTNWEYKVGFLDFPDAWVYVPESYTPRVPGKRALVFHLIGCGQMTFQAAQGGGWPEAAEAYGLVIVIPSWINPAHPNFMATNVECYNYGYQGKPSRNDRDHRALIDAAEDIVSQFPEYQIDPDQVYLAGLSAGAAVAIQVACMEPDLFAGVAAVVSPGIGSDQGTAVMPPAITTQTVISECEGYANGSSHPDADSYLKQQVYAVVSDNNGLPAGNGGMDISKFMNQAYWDGDKFCPHAYKTMTTEALVSIADLPSTPAESQVVIASGVGPGCEGGEHSLGDSGDVECIINDAVIRPWEALADIYRGPGGHVRVVQIQQDTMRHSWPVGAAGFGDKTITPTREQLDAEGFIDHSTGGFNIDMANAAPNGKIGAIYFNTFAFDFPMYMAALWNSNNPRLGDPVAENMAPTIENLTVTPDGNLPPFEARVEAIVSDPDGDPISSIILSLENQTAGIQYDPVPAPVSGAAVVAVDQRFIDLQAGHHRLTVSATDSAGQARQGQADFDLGEVSNLPPEVSVTSAGVSGADCIQAEGSASDSDGSIVGLAAVVLGLGDFPADLSGGQWTFEHCGLACGSYRLFAQAVDDDGALATTGISIVDLLGGPAESAEGDLTEHCDAGRVVRFSDQYMDYRDRYCVRDGFSWICESFTLYRCQDQEEWTDDPAECGSGELPEVELGGDLQGSDSASVGDELIFEAGIENLGPDPASAVYLRCPPAPGFTIVGTDSNCLDHPDGLICNLGDLGAGSSQQLQLTARVTNPGLQVFKILLGSAQTDPEIQLTREVQVGPGPDGGFDGGTDAGSDSGTDSGTDAGTDGGADQNSTRPDGGGIYDFRNDPPKGCACKQTSGNRSLLILLPGLLLLFFRRKPRTLPTPGTE